MTTREMTCVVCPAGCALTVTIADNGSIVDVKGNTCPRGKKYAEDEVTHPLRTLTSTVTVTTDCGKAMLPVKTDRPIPRETLFEAMGIIRSFEASSPIKIGDVLIENFIENGTNLVACKDVD